MIDVRDYCFLYMESVRNQFPKWMWCQFNPYVRLDGTSLCNGICFWCKHNRLSVQYIYIHLKLSLVILRRSYLFDNQIIKSISRNQLAWITKRSNHWFIQIIDYSIFDLYICTTSLLFTKYSIIESQWTKKKQEGGGVSLPAQDLDIQLCTCISWYLLCLVSEVRGDLLIFMELLTITV